MNLYFYRQLPPREQFLYKEIDRRIARHEPCLQVVATESPESLFSIIRFVILDHPEYYWSSGGCRMTRGPGNETEIDFEYLVSAQETAETDQMIFSAIQGIGAEKYADSADKARAISAWLSENVRYDTAKDAVFVKTNQTVYSVFVEKRSLCIGIAKAFDLIARVYGLDSMTVLGYLFQDEKNKHAWNLVNIGGQYLHVDVAIGYPCFRELWRSWHPALEPCVLVSDAFISPTHHISEPALYPLSASK